jgi:hypothetical protein
MQHPEDDIAILRTQLEDLAACIDGKPDPHCKLALPFVLEQTR